MKTMRAVWREEYCAPEKAGCKNVDIPMPGPGEVLVRVMATTVNRTDCAILTGKPFIMRFFTGFGRPKSPIPGTDFAGVVESVGEGVTAFKAGDRVWGFDDQGLATQAEYAAIPVKKAILPLPGNISFADAAASAEGAHYAYNFLSKVKLRAGQRALVLGATGAIGSALLQFCKYHGLQVTATGPTPDLKRVTALGADRVIDYLKEDFTATGETYDYVFDAVGKSTFAICKRLLVQKGIYISSEPGPGGQNIFLALWGVLRLGRRVIFPVPSNIRRSLGFVAELTAQGKFKPLVDKHYAIEKAGEAYAYAASGKKIGNVILDLQ